ncbi:carboxypeptidase inhibitor SmCI-like isoform X2 [Tachyglossus aculeatus]|uniref:carboxypeptidase inhibitor SmCI-like isoform X2 n=1 Tax=Tachyglossus aculeatus TaxID=9261 RepID=UPI0018F3FA23|nr:carboxypeptidase inhibitor SmCI-like isoform X2 [Tachyglossus aculeatus]
MKSDGLFLLGVFLALGSELTWGPGRVQGDSEISSSICKLPYSVGPCKTFITMYYFNAKANRCKLFIYGGCEGNENRFYTLDECQEICAENPSLHPELSSTQLLSLADSETSSSICQLPYSVGLCKARILRYYFDAETKQCEEFIYGGCGGNENQFHTLEECRNACDSSQISKSICQLPYSVGLCKARLQRYYFSVQTQQCRQFYYGGCGGNENRFSTLAKCRDTCLEK